MSSTTSASTYANVTASCPVLESETSKQPTLTQTVRQAVLTAVHTEMHTKQARERNIIITGLNRSNSIQDRDLVSKLIFDEFGLEVRIIQCKRFGKSPTTADGRPQPLRVVFQSAAVARDIIASAKYLRRSIDEYVSNNVFINADLTRAEAEAAYHARCARRRSQQLKAKPNSILSMTSVQPAQHQQSVSKAATSALHSQPVSNYSSNAVSLSASTVNNIPSNLITVVADVHQPSEMTQIQFGSVQPEFIQPLSSKVPFTSNSNQQAVFLPAGLSGCSSQGHVSVPQPCSVPSFQPYSQSNIYSVLSTQPGLSSSGM
jgi:hypothetical protein